MNGAGFDVAGGSEAPAINKLVVLEAYKAACLVIAWARSIEEKTAGRTVGGELDAELESDLDRWAFLETLDHKDICSYDQIDDAARLMGIMASLELAMMLSAQRDEVFSIRREWQRLGKWMKDFYGIDPVSEGQTYIEFVSEEIIPLSQSRYYLMEHMPELKQGWNEGGAEGLKDYMLVLWLSIDSGKRP